MMLPQGFLRQHHLNNGNIPTTAAEYNRADAITIFAILNANRPSGEERTADGRPYKPRFLTALSFRKWKYADHLRRI